MDKIDMDNYMLYINLKTTDRLTDTKSQPCDTDVCLNY